MIRILSGQYKGRKLVIDLPKGVKQTFRPTQSKTRSAVLNKIDFSKIAPDGGIKGRVVLDVFCGCGSFGFEALSRGAAYVLFIDNFIENIKLVNRNAEFLGLLDRCDVLCCDASALPAYSKLKYEIVYLDPPYYMEDLVSKALYGLIDGNWLAEDAIIVLEIAAKQKFLKPIGVRVLDESIYGASKVIYLSKDSVNAEY